MGSMEPLCVSLAKLPAVWLGEHTLIIILLCIQVSAHSFLSHFVLYGTMTTARHTHLRLATILPASCYIPRPAVHTHKL
jgi:hypothetical protein